MLRPESEAELAAMIRAATGPLTVQGGGTRDRKQPGGTVLSTSGLRGVTLYEPAALTLVVRAGTPLAEVEALLAAEGQCLAFEPPSRRHARQGGAMLDLLDDEDRQGFPAPEDASTIGGVIAANASGPRRVKAGAARDSLIGVRLVDGAGEIVANGGRVMKNVTGYDLVKLMAGSHGTLGVLTEVALKTAPVPPETVTLRLDAPDPAAAVAALTAALTGPWDVSGAGWLPDLGALLRIEGLPTSTGLRRDGLIRVLDPWGAAEAMEVAAATAAWRRLGTVAAGWGLEAEGMIEGAVWRIVCRPSQVPSLLAANGAHVLALDWGGGLVVLGLPSRSLPVLPPGAVARRLTSVPMVLPVPDPVTARLNDGLRAQFDPRGLFAGA